MNLVPVDHDPFAQQPSAGPQMVPVDHDPFASQPSVASDVAGGVQGGIIRGAASLAGLPGMVVGALDSAADEAARQTVGRAVNYFKGRGAVRDDQPAPAPSSWSPQSILPMPEDAVKAVEGVIGSTYRPQTTPGKYAASIGEMLGGGVGPRAAIIGGAASEGAGQLTAGTVAEPYARMAAALLAPMAVNRAAAPVRGDPNRQGLVDTLRAEGVPVTAGEASGSKALRYAESALSDLPGGGAGAREFAQRQSQAFNAAAARRMGEAADNLGPETMARAATRIGDDFERLSARNALTPDQQFAQNLGQTLNEYNRVLPSEQRGIVGNLVTDVVERIRAGGGTLPGRDYQTIRSRMSRMSNNARGNDPEFADAIRGIRNALDDAMGRSIAPADQAAWQTARREYGNMKTLERAMRGAGEQTAAGNVSPQMLRSATAQRDPTAYVRGEGDFADLARAGAGVMQPMPQSGTAPRSAIASMAQTLAGGGAAGYFSGSPSVAAGTMAAMAAPSVVGRALMSRPVQAYLMPRAGAADPATDRVVRALLGYDDQSNLPRSR